MLTEIDVTIDDRLAVVTLNRPAERNAMTLAMWHGIARIFKDLGERADTRVIILTGAGGNFSVGADVSEFSEVRSDAAQSTAYEHAVDAASEAIAASSKPVIAVLTGYCLGGGCHLSMACDFRFAHSHASLGIPAAKLSIVYGIRSTQRLLSLVGLTHAKRILFAAERIGAEEAVRIGLADRASSNPITDAKAFAENIAALAPLSITGAKLILNGLAMGAGSLDKAAVQAFIDHVSGSADYQEGRNAFAEKRAPAFVGR